MSNDGDKRNQVKLCRMMKIEKDGFDGLEFNSFVVWALLKSSRLLSFLLIGPEFVKAQFFSKPSRFNSNCINRVQSFKLLTSYRFTMYFFIIPK